MQHVKKLVRKKVPDSIESAAMKYRNFGKIHCLPIKWTSGLLGIVRCIPCSRNKGNIVIRNLTGKKEESKKRK